MTPEEKKQFEDLKEKVRNLELVLGVDFIENLRERIVADAVVSSGSFDTTGISGSENGSNVNLRDIVITFPSVGGTPPDTATQTITVVDAPDSTVDVLLGTTTYKLGVWE